MKILYRKQLTIPFDDSVITQPNQAFTPRQILEQFARNEVVPIYNESSDSLTDENYDDDTLLDSELHEFDDAMEAQTYIEENQFKLIENEEKQTTDPVRTDPQKGTDPASGGTQPEPTQAQD